MAHDTSPASPPLAVTKEVATKDIMPPATGEAGLEETSRIAPTPGSVRSIAQLATESLQTPELLPNGIVQVIAVESPETTYVVPSVKFLFSSKEVASRIARLAVALDAIGASTLPILLDGKDEELTGLDEQLNLPTALSQASLFPTIRTLTFGGGVSALIGLASGKLNHSSVKDIPLEFDNDFLTILATRHYLDPATLQNLREVRSSTELLQLFSRRRLGWLFDEICRLACLEVRKRLNHPATIEAIAFGNTGAVLGRAVIEPVSFSL